MTDRAIDWGSPRPAAEWMEARERIVARVPVEVVRALRERARVEGVSLSVLVGRLLAASVDMAYEDRIGSREPWPAAADALFD